MTVNVKKFLVFNVTELTSLRKVLSAREFLNHCSKNMLEMPIYKSPRI